MKIEVACPKCQTALELTASDTEVRDYLALESATKNVEFRDQAKKFARNFSEDGDALAIYWSFLSQVERSTLGAYERFYEYAYVVEKLCHEPKRNILDVGSSGTSLPATLAAMGHKVTCLDLSAWQMTWPGVEVIQDDLLQLRSPLGSFDYITCVSTVEHFGLGERYGGKESVDGDLEGMAILRTLLRPEGLLILTVPVGLAAVVYPAHRIYNAARFSRLISGFRVFDKRFFVRGPVTRGVFYPRGEEEAFAGEPMVAHLSCYSIACCLLGRRD